ncbi:MAG TPA: MFS transporter [Paracoccaceae bacterium]|nr:MFS transporter [Paracoccaceae bacterium]
MTDVAATPRSERWIAFSNKGFRLYWGAILCASFSVQIQTVAVGWQVYDMTRNPLHLGLVGLSQFLPSLLLVLVTGAVADRFSRRTILRSCLLVEASCAAGLLAVTFWGLREVAAIFAIMIVFGTARAFFNPARQSIISNLVPPAHLANAITMGTTAFHMSTIAGPMVGGLLYGIQPELAYGTSVALLVTAFVLTVLMPPPVQSRSTGYPTWDSLAAGFRFIWREKVVLGAISLDLFAVLMGGAAALMPVYARDVLEVGPVGLGFLRAGMGIGGIVVGFWLMAHPIRDNAGSRMLWSVGAFGLCIGVFALSETVWLSVAALVLAGGFDMVSVYIRNTLIQSWTPDDLRGRVSAVNQVFVGASNELGAFRAGSAAALIGAVPAVLIGGVGTMAIAVLWARWFPDLRRIRSLEGAG